MTDFLTVLYIFIIFFNPISIYFPYANYIDEFVCLILIIMSIIKLLTAHKIKKSNSFYIIIIILVITFIGLLSNVLFGYMNDISVIFRDFIHTFKFLFCFICPCYLLQNYKSKCLKYRLIKLSKIFITIFFVFGTISLFFDLGMGDSIRYGLRSFQFIFTYYTYLVASVVLLLAVIMCDQKKNFIYYFMGCLTLLFTLRTKAFVHVAIVILLNLIFYYSKNKEKICFKSIFKIQYIIPLSLSVILLTKNKILEYISWGVGNSIRVATHVVGLKMAVSHFPFGTGFGTYGTNISYYSNSPLYFTSKYGKINYPHLIEYGYATISDVYWPSIYAQFGFIGFILYLLSFIFLFKEILDKKEIDFRVKKASLSILAYMLISSLAESIFTNETGVFMPIVISMLMCFEYSSQNKKNYI